MTKHWCKECFKTVVDDTASDKYLLMQGEDKVCPSCGKFGPVVAQYFKYGELSVTEDGKRIIHSAKHVGVNPDYSYFSTTPVYASSEN